MTVRNLLVQRFALLGLDRKICAEERHDILLAVSELVTNACAATPHAAITFRAVFEDGNVWVGVWDSSDKEPTPRPVMSLDIEDITPDPHALDEGHWSDQIGGLGLPLVMALTRDRGIEPTPPRGKWVWARFHH
jgi:anti-sigma regulatory factor (Ser/Thr protein kinase)